MVSFNFAPRGWIFANGQVLPISQYAAVFSLMGTTYGGNGTSNFQLPNLQGRVAMGQGSGAGLTTRTIGEIGGTESANILTSNMPAHTHPITGSVAVATTVGVTNTAGDKLGGNNHVLAVAEAFTTPPAGVANYSDQAPNGLLGGVSSAVTSTLAAGLTGNSLPLSIMQPYLVMSYVIALTGIFPSRN